MDIYWPVDTYLVSNVAREAKRVAHPCSRAAFLNRRAATWQRVVEDFKQVVGMTVIEFMLKVG